MMQSRPDQATLDKDLLSAAASGNLQLVTALLANGADIDTRDDEYEETPLMIAAEKGHCDVVHLLLCQGANTLLKSKNDVTAIFKAARWNKPACLTVLVDCLINKYNTSPEQLVKHLEIDNARLILQSFGSRYDIAAPMMKLIDFLRAHKINEQVLGELVPDHYYMPAKPDAAEAVKKSISTVELKPAAKKYSPEETEKLISAARNNDLVGVKAAIAAGAEINASTMKHGGNALHYASKNNFTNIMTELIKLGADINCRSKLDDKEHVNSATPLIWAAQNKGDIAAIELLLKAKAQVNAARNDGHTALHFAAEYYNVDACELLLKHGANATATNICNHTPLYRAVHKNHIKAIKLFVENLIATHNGKHIELLGYLQKNSEFKRLIEMAKGQDTSLALMKLINFLLANNTSYAEINTLFPDQYSFTNTKFKEDILIHLQSLPAAKRLAMCNSILTEPTHPYRVILSMQRGSRPCKLGHGILKQVADLKAATELSIKKANQPDLNNGNATPLYTAAMNGNIAKVKQLIQEGADCASTAYTGGILFGAAQSGDIDIINLLVENGADPKLTKLSVKQVFSLAFNTQNKHVKARLEAYFKHFPTNAIAVTPADIAEIFGHTEAAGLLRILAGQDPVVATEQAPALTATAESAQPSSPVAEADPAAAPPAPVPTLYPTVAPAVQQESSALDAYMSARKNISPAEAPAVAQKVALTAAVVATPAAAIKPVAPLQPTVVSTLSIFTPGKAIELVFDSPNPEINVPVLQPQKIAPSDVTSSYALRNSLFSLDEPVTAAQPTFPAWMQELDTPSSRTTSENESLALQQLEALEPAPTHTYATEYQQKNMVPN